MLSKTQPRRAFHVVAVVAFFTTLILLMSWSTIFNTSKTQSPVLPLPPHQDGLGGSGSGDRAGERHCHFHAGVEHCVGGNVDESASRCERIDRDYNIPLRIGALFVVLIATSIGVYGPILVAAILPPKTSLISAVLKQFGTGVIISTAFVHQILLWRSAKKGDTAEEDPGKPAVSAELVNVAILEAGIMFHSLLSTARKILLASGFAFVTPVGMAVGICLLKVFNGNDPSTIVAIGSIDAFSAGILVWVEIVAICARVA
ncbi:hypothetical protein CHGG_03318 [Chaetomium globosum CBS 148.51]|uniref:Uncharacterized protein n=1 Tax=Chaetomium globosum (strain ATCC 6205 / CBS 148.51 / DSM 1962 / NBRC 6347 / NRRL 1970) TaxID=306901 RepID=Q2H8Y6_CHAGB|nr:uncharacterized protein CHGG_03318 [Chaetomium globosum CBS 148.51]EAQ91383.1 hypothetical protein CHGG_03318 [Chaetomium globosum CBS 148.51]